MFVLGAAFNISERSSFQHLLLIFDSPSLYS